MCLGVWGVQKMLIRTITSSFAWPCLNVFFTEMSCRTPISTWILIDGFKMQTKNSHQGNTRIMEYKQVRASRVFWRTVEKKNQCAGSKGGRLPILMTQKKCLLLSSLPWHILNTLDTLQPRNNLNRQSKLMSVLEITHWLLFHVQISVTSKKCLVIGPVKFYFCFHFLNWKKCGNSMSSKYFEF